MSTLDEKKHKAGASGEDAESHIQPAKSDDYDDPTVNGPGLHRQLKNRHIAMISIGGVIGTGQCFSRVTRSCH
jgi:amino acid permease